MTLYAKIAGVVFGTVMIALSFTITIETLLRKFFAFSLGGVDELSGYAVAICAPLAFAIALIQQSHIRINLLHARMPRRVQGVLNVLATLSMSVLALYLIYFTINTVRDTAAYRSIAQTPWATPLIYPQSVWLVSMCVFAIAGLVMSFKATALLLRGEWDTLNQQFGPESAEAELKAELDDLQTRGEGVAQ